MDDVMDCIANNHYTNELDKQRDLDPDTVIANGVHERFAVPDDPKEIEELTAVEKKFKANLKLDKMIAEPLGRYFLISQKGARGYGRKATVSFKQATGSFEQKKGSFIMSKTDREHLAILKIFDEIDDYRLNPRPSEVDVQILIDLFDNSIPAAHKNKISDLRPKLRQVVHNHSDHKYTIHETEETVPIVTRIASILEKVPEDETKSKDDKVEDKSEDKVVEGEENKPKENEEEEKKVEEEVVEKEEEEEVVVEKEEEEEEKEDTHSPTVSPHTSYKANERDPLSIELRSFFDDLDASLKAEYLIPFFSNFQNDNNSCSKYRKLKYAASEKNKIEFPNFYVFRELGRGAFGAVSGARLLTTGQMVALKGLNRKLVKGKHALKLVKNEKKILKKLGKRPSLFCVWLKYSFMDKETMYFALPLMTGGDLDYHNVKTFKRNGYGLETSRFFAAEILLGIEHMHNLGIIYRDLKPENVLLDDDGHTRISDLGLAVMCDWTPSTRRNQTISGKAGTPGYWPPEMIEKQPYAFDADWWSYGVMVYEFMFGVCPFSEKNTDCSSRDDGTLNWEITVPNTFPDDSIVPDDVSEFILSLLVRDRLKRKGTNELGANELKNMKFFKDYNWTQIATHQHEAPWKPPPKINAKSQDELAGRDNEHEYYKLKLTEKDTLKNFHFKHKNAHQRDMVTVLRLEKEGKLTNLPAEKVKSSTCNIL